MGFGGWGDEEDLGGIERGEPWSEQIIGKIYFQLKT